jgi:hypothetical protein
MARWAKAVATGCFQFIHHRDGIWAFLSKVHDRRWPGWGGSAGAAAAESDEFEERVTEARSVDGEGRWHPFRVHFLLRR